MHDGRADLVKEHTVLIPAPGSDERKDLVRRVAARMWQGRDERPFADVGEYWSKTFEQLAEDAIEAIELSARD